MEQKYWNKPEKTNVKRRAFKLDKNRPGSELVAEMAAAMASSSIVFKKHGNDSEYSDVLLKHAEKLFEFARTYREEYHR